MIRLTHESISSEEVERYVATESAGATVVFLGTAREATKGRRTTSLFYEAYEAMAREQLGQLADQAAARFDIAQCAIVHRLGEVVVGEVSVAIAVSAAHRGPAFDACRWLIDRIKQVVPIWKCENWADGTSQWVHPTAEKGDNNA